MNDKMDFIMERIEYFSKQLNIPLPGKVVFDYDEWVKLSNYMSHPDTCLLGANHKKGKIIYVNLDRTYSQIENTVAHELLHTVDPELPHGPEFDECVRKIKLGIYHKESPWYRKYMSRITYWLNK